MTKAKAKINQSKEQRRLKKKKKKEITEII